MDKIWKYLTLGLMAVLVALSIYGFFKFRSFDAEATRLRNELASKDKTVQTIDGAYTKLVQEFDNLKVTNADLQKTIQKSKQDVISAQQIAVFWQKKYDTAVKPVPVPPGTPGSPSDWVAGGKETCEAEQTEYSAVSDYGLVKAGCRVLTYDPGIQTRTILEPGSRPLRLDLALTRDTNKQWHSYVKVAAPDDQNISIDIGSTSVNIEPLELKWYEKISVGVDLGIGSGVLAGANANYEFGQFRLGPSLWGVITSDKGSVFYGLNFQWSPFKSTTP